MGYDQPERKVESVYSKRIKAGKRRTYFFDVRATKANDYFLTITESRKRFNEDGYDRHKIFLYKEDFNKFVKGLNEAVDYVKTELMPNFDFDSYNHEDYDEQSDGYPDVNLRSAVPIETVAMAAVPTQMETAPIAMAPVAQETPIAEPDMAAPAMDEEVDKW